MKYDWNSLHRIPPQKEVNGVLTSDTLLTICTRGMKDKQPYQIIALAKLVDKAWMDDNYPFCEIQVDYWTTPKVGTRDVKREGSDVYLVKFETGTYALTWYRPAGVYGRGTSSCPYQYHDEEWLDTESMGAYTLPPIGHALVELPNFAIKCLKENK